MYQCCWPEMLDDYVRLDVVFMLLRVAASSNISLAGMDSDKLKTNQSRGVEVLILKCDRSVSSVQVVEYSSTSRPDL